MSYLFLLESITAGIKKTHPLYYRGEFFLFAALKTAIYNAWSCILFFILS